ncbi:hypothetical protein YC2023_097539 [Brassica napus]
MEGNNAMKILEEIKSSDLAGVSPLLTPLRRVANHEHQIRSRLLSKIPSC